MKPDRFEQMVEQVQERWRGTTIGTRHLVPSYKAVKLLRRQHAELRRLVVNHQGLDRDSYWYMTIGVNGQWLNRSNLLAAFDAWKKGKP